MKIIINYIEGRGYEKVKRLHLFSFIFVALFLLLSACSNNSTEEAKKEEAPSENKEENNEYPMTVEHAFGETVIESKPERVATVQWGNHDVALALDVVPVGFSAANFGVQEDDNGILPWTKEKLDELGETEPNVFQDTDGLDFEAVSDANPDVILAAYSGITEEDYETLSEIAPVIAYPEAAWATNWKDTVLYDAKGMGMEEEGKQLVADTESSLEKKTAAYPQLEGKTIVWVNFSPDDLSSLHIYTPIDARVDFLYDLGLTYPEEITDMIDDPDSYTLDLSSENAMALENADIIVGYGDQELLETLQNDPLLGVIPAIERGSVAFIEADSPIVAAGTPNPLSIEYTIDDYLALLGDAADIVDEN